MRRLISLFVVSAAVLVAVSLTYAATVKIVAEGEDYFAISPSMVKTTGSQQASGGTYVEIPLRRPHAENEAAPADTGNARYKLNVPSAGTYTLWLLANWYDSCGNSFFVIVDDKPAVVVGEDGTYGKWHWVKGPQLSLTAGQHVIRIQNREDGAKLDQFLLINTTRYVPVRAETRTPAYIVTE